MIREKIDFDFIYKEVEDTYGLKGNVSVPPSVVLKMMLLLVLYNVRSKRELMITIPERSFAQSTPFGLKRARWRGIWRMQIQDFLIAAVQNITILIRKNRTKLSKGQANQCKAVMILKPERHGCP